MRLILAILIGLTITCCNTDVIRHAEREYRYCDIEPLESSGGSVRLLITCPNEEPVEKVYRKKR